MDPITQQIFRSSSAKLSNYWITEIESGSVINGENISVNGSNGSVDICGINNGRPWACTLNRVGTIVESRQLATPSTGTSALGLSRFFDRCYLSGHSYSLSNDPMPIIAANSGSTGFSDLAIQRGITQVNDLGEVLGGFATCIGIENTTNQAGDHFVVIGGYTGSPTNREAFIAKFDSTLSSLLWHKLIRISNANTQIRSLFVTDAGEILAVLQIGDSPSDVGELLLFNSSGTLTSRRQISSVSDVNFSHKTVRIDLIGNVALVPFLGIIFAASTPDARSGFTDILFTRLSSVYNSIYVTASENPLSISNTGRSAAYNYVDGSPFFAGNINNHILISKFAANTGAFSLNWSKKLAKDGETIQVKNISFGSNGDMGLIGSTASGKVLVCKLNAYSTGTFDPYSYENMAVSQSFRGASIIPQSPTAITERTVSTGFSGLSYSYGSVSTSQTEPTFF